MTAKELLRSQIDDAGNQLNAVLNGIASDQAGFKATPATMGVSEQVVHLCEAYQALITEIAGGKYEWGSFAPQSNEWAPLLEEFRALRAKAAEAVLSGDDDHLKLGNAYIVAHDYYHVGQLCQARIALDPTWDPYAIYA